MTIYNIKFISNLVVFVNELKRKSVEEKNSYKMQNSIREFNNYK